MNESWVTAKGFDGFYEVSDLGRVRSVDRVDAIGRNIRGVILRNARKGKERKDGGAYLRIRLSVNTIVYDVTVHSLVLSSFVGSRPEGMHGCHNDGDVMNNSLSNLRWDTPKENQRDKIRHGTVARGERNGGAKLSRRQVLEIIHSPLGDRPAGRKYGVSATQIRRIRDGESWPHLGVAYAAWQLAGG